MIGIIRLFQDAYGNNMGARTFCQLSRYFGGVLITDNKKIHALEEFPCITYDDAVRNRQKFTKLIVYNTQFNMFGGQPADHTQNAVRLIQTVSDLYFYNCDPILDIGRNIPPSYEAVCPGLTRANSMLIQDSVRLDRRNTHLTLYLAAQIDHEIIDQHVKKDFTAVYFGNARQKKRQAQIDVLLSGVKQPLIVGHESEKFPWFYYTPDFYATVSRAYVTPIIGDDKLHYETGIPSLRLYETWHTATIGLIDARFTQDVGLDERFYFSTPEEFHKKAKMISENKLIYYDMLKKQQSLLAVIKKKYRKAKYDWKAVARAKRDKKKAKDKQLKVEKQLKHKKTKESFESKKHLL